MPARTETPAAAEAIPAADAGGRADFAPDPGPRAGPAPAPESGPAFSPAGIASLLRTVRRPLRVVRDRRGRTGLAPLGEPAAALPEGVEAIAALAPLYPEWLGDRAFCEVHRLRFPYVAGSMANGIATARLVIEMAKAGMLASFGAAGLSLERIDAAIGEIRSALGEGGAPFASCLIHTPDAPDLEERLVDLYLRRGVAIVEASAFTDVTPAVVRYACSGLARDPSGRIARPRAVIAKVSRPEVARRFLSPAPPEVLDALLARGALTRGEAALAARVPLAEDVTVEADSAGHTDNRPLTALLPAIAAIRDEVAAREGYARPPRVGAAGGLGTPAALAAAFALGAAYVLTGSVNQASIESGLSLDGKRLLAAAGVADVVMAPAADMFEAGVRVQVLRRGTLFGPRAQRLHALYEAHDSLEAIAPEVRASLEREVFQEPLESAWAATRRYWEARDPREVARAERDPKCRMALLFRSYLGRASRFAIAGETARRLDYQIWCGPAMGAFNAWAAGSFLEDLANRGVVAIARNLLEGAAVVTRAQEVRSMGVPVPAAAFDFRPRPLA